MSAVEELLLSVGLSNTWFWVLTSLSEIAGFDVFRRSISAAALELSSTSRRRRRFITEVMAASGSTLARLIARPRDFVGTTKSGK